MTTYTATKSIAADVTGTFAYLADPTNLPHYFPRMTEAHFVGPELVRSTAVVDDDGPRDGSDEVEPVTADAWFRTDEADHSVAWGSPDAGDDYHGSLRLADDNDGGTRLELEVTTVHDYPGVQESLDEALESIAAKLTVESD